jgi:LacI family transcriptional regulator
MRGNDKTRAMKRRRLDDATKAESEDGASRFDGVIASVANSPNGESQAVAAGRRPTMTDVARLAGVSQSSVSLVLNKMMGARISDATRDRVMEVAREIGYALPGARRQVRPALERTVIAYLVDEISTSPHPVVSFDGARDLSWESGFLLQAYVTRSNAELEAATIEIIRRDPNVLGVIYSTIFTRRVSPPPTLDEIPTVLLNCYAPERRMHSVVPGEVAGAFVATQHLIDHGHRRIGFINGEPWMDASADRLKGYRQALATADIAFSPDILRHGDWLPLTGYQLALELLQVQNPPTAIFCANDLMAIGALEAASETGLRVPDDVSVMGYDDQELARYTHPPLSTLTLPNYEMGRRAAEMLIDLAVRSSTVWPKAIKIDGPLIERSSVGLATRRGK